MASSYFDASPDGGDAPRRRRWSASRLGAAAVIVVLAGFWVWAFTLAPRSKVDALEDQSFAGLANQRCQVAMQAIGALPSAHETPDAPARAAVIEQANRILEDLLAGLRADATGLIGRDRELVDQWLADWGAYLGARQRFAERIRTDPEVRFAVPGRPGGQITQTMDAFSRTNRMTECTVPLDL